MGCLLSVLISFLSAPFSGLFVFLTRRWLHRAQQHPSPSPAADHHRTASHDPVALPPWEASLGVTRYKSSSSSSGSSEGVECAFCLCSVEEGEEVRELRCRHLFHKRCLDRWLAHRGATCPLCRDALVPHGAAAGKGGGGEEEEEEEEEEEDPAVPLLAHYAPWWMWVNWKGAWSSILALFQNSSYMLRMAELLSGTHTREHESMGCLPSVLISFLSAPFSSLFVFLTRRLHGAQHSDHRRTASDDPVVRPPREPSLGVTRYESSASSSEAVECVFCLCSVEEGEEVRELRCRHLFHQRCLDRWLAQRGATCPLCRDALVPHEAAAGKRGGGEEEEEEEEEEVEREELGDLAVLLLANYVPWHVGMVNWY